ncbi:hypothetical protein EV177_004748, partial [Coemansia sp. RSA 1804]
AQPTSCHRCLGWLLRIWRITTTTRERRRQKRLPQCWSSGWRSSSACCRMSDPMWQRLLGQSRRQRSSAHGLTSMATTAPTSRPGLTRCRPNCQSIARLFCRQAAWLPQHSMLRAPFAAELSARLFRCSMTLILRHSPLSTVSATFCLLLRAGLPRSTVPLRRSMCTTRAASPSLTS